MNLLHERGVAHRQFPDQDADRPAIASDVVHCPSDDMSIVREACDPDTQQRSSDKVKRVGHFPANDGHQLPLLFPLLHTAQIEERRIERGASFDLLRLTSWADAREEDGMPLHHLGDRRPKCRYIEGPTKFKA